MTTEISVVTGRSPQGANQKKFLAKSHIQSKAYEMMSLENQFLISQSRATLPSNSQLMSDVPPEDIDKFKMEVNELDEKLKRKFKM